MALLTACATPRPAPRAQPGASPDEPAAFTIVATQCASCHRASIAEAPPEAVAVLDFDRPGWSSRLDEEQWAFFEKRLKQQAGNDAVLAVRAALGRSE